MNWVGGSRNRLVMKNDLKKQREFFEKRKMQQKLKDLGIALPASPRGSGYGSMDLVTLFIVNQIAAKKENRDPPKVAVLSSSKRGSSKGNKPLVLPMSPCSPSQLSLVESPPQDSVQGTRKTRHVIPQGFKCRQLSPVLESAFSDISASDYLPPIANPLSPFSSTSSASSGQGIFPLKLKLQQRDQVHTQLPPHCSPSSWDTSGLEQIKPFSQPRGMTDDMSWSCGSNLPLYQLETPTAVQVLFGGPEPDETEVRDRAIRYSLNQPEDKEPMLDFTFNQSETEQRFEEDVFRGFSNEEYENEACQFGSAKSKIYLKDGTPVKASTPQTVPDSQCMGMELSSCSDINFSHPGHDTGPMNGCGYSPSYSCSGGYISSDSDDDEESCQPCLQASASASSYVEQACCSEAVDQGSQGKPKQRHSQPRPLTPFRQNFRADQKVLEKAVCPEKALGSNSQQTESSTHQFAFPHPLVQTQSSEICKCKKSSSETRDAETQTVDVPTAATCDASTQCSVVADSTSSAPGLNLYLPPVDTSVQHPATGRQTGTAAEPHTASSGELWSGGKHTPWGKKKLKAGSLSGSSSMNKVTANNSNGKVFQQRPINHFLDGRVTENEEGRDERGRHGNGPLMKDLSDEVTSGTRGVNTPSEEAHETLQEIADILLLLKQRKKEG